MEGGGGGTASTAQFARWRRAWSSAAGAAGLPMRDTWLGRIVCLGHNKAQCESGQCYFVLLHHGGQAAPANLDHHACLLPCHAAPLHPPLDFHRNLLLAIVLPPMSLIHSLPLVRTYTTSIDLLFVRMIEPLVMQKLGRLAFGQGG